MNQLQKLRPHQSPTIIEEWRIVDKWWLPQSELIERKYVEVEWNNRRLTFIREAPDKVWRIIRGGTQTTPETRPYKDESRQDSLGPRRVRKVQSCRRLLYGEL
jgi:hypothetical protein